VNVLERIVESTRDEVRRRREELPLAALERGLAGRGEDRPFAEALSRPGVSLIAEHKRASPSAGTIRDDLGLIDVVGAYQRGGAAALSVLTEERHFAGSLDDLREARAACALPLLRKDFIVDPYQVTESAVAGADAILLIVAALPAKELAHLYAQARDLDLDVLVEVHDGHELSCALEVLDADVIAINNRDLTDFTVDLQRTYELLADVPAGKTVVSESGIHAREQVDALENVGIDAVLVGETLMRAPDLEDAVRNLAGRPLDLGEEL